jgi:hypothetical protein
LGSHPTEKREAPLEAVSWSLERRRRKTIAIHVARDGSVRVLAPRSTPQQAIDAFVASKTTWIARKLKEFSLLPVPEAVAFRDGARLPHLGGRLTIRTEPGKGAAALSEAGELLVPLRCDATERTLHRKVNDWYLQETRQLSETIARALSVATASLGIPSVKGVRSRRMRRRWGSCLPSGIIILNSELLGAPRECVEYVVAHELCHLKEPNHSRRFYALMTELVPDWRELRRRLNREAPLGFLEPPR